MFVVQAAVAQQVTILAPRDDNRVDFERMGLRVHTYTLEQLEDVDRGTAISLGQSIDASVLVLTGARMPAEAFESLFAADEVRVAFDDLFRRGGVLFLGPLSGAVMNNFPAEMRDYFEGHDLFLPRNVNRETSRNGIGFFTAYANPDLLDLPILSEPNSLAEGDWGGVKNVIFYWREFPDSVLPILVGPEGGPDGSHPAMLLQKDILGSGMFIMSQARDLTRLARSEFWENLLAATGTTTAAPGTTSGAAPGTAGGPALTGEGKPLLFLDVNRETSFNDLSEDRRFSHPAIWEQFDEVELKVWDTGETPQKATRARLGVLGDHLVAAFHNTDPAVGDLTTNVSVRDGEAWTDDSVELVVVPTGSGTVHHWIVSASGAIYDAKDRNRAWDSNATADVKINSDGWQVVLAVPLTDLFEGGEVPELFQANLTRQEQGVGEISSWVTPIHAVPSAHSVGHVSRLSPRDLAARLVGRGAAGPAAADAEGGFDVWQASPWENGHSLKSKPGDEAAGNQPGTVELHMPGRGNDAGVLLVRNHGAESLVLRVEAPKELKAQDGQEVPFYDVVTLYRGVPRLSSYETLGFDPLEDMGNAALLSVAPGETAMLWIDAAGDAPAGQYRGELSLLPITLKDHEPVKVALDLRIYEADIPEQLPLQVYTWGPYMGWIREKSDPMDYVELALDSHINTFNVAYPHSAIKPGPEISRNPDDYMSNVALYLEHGRDVRFVYSYHLFDKFDSALKRAGFQGETMDEQWQSLFVEWVGQWMNALQAAGVGYDDFWIQIEDEPRSNALPELIAKTALLNEHFPEIRTWVSIAQWSTEKDLQALQPHIDLWVPEFRRITMRETAADELSFYKAQGPFWPYRCSRQMDMKTLLGYYRQRGIEEYLLGADGMVLWAFNAWRNNPWVQWDSPRSGGGHAFDEGLVYRGAHGPVPTTRLFAFRAGIEDFVLMHLLSEAKSNASGDQESKIDELMEQAAGVLKTTDPAAIEEWRRETLTLLEGLN